MTNWYRELVNKIMESVESTDTQGTDVIQINVSAANADQAVRDIVLAAQSHTKQNIRINNFSSSSLFLNSLLKKIANALSISEDAATLSNSDVQSTVSRSKASSAYKTYHRPPLYDRMNRAINNGAKIIIFEEVDRVSSSTEHAYLVAGFLHELLSKKQFFDMADGKNKQLVPFPKLAEVTIIFV